MRPGETDERFGPAPRRHRGKRTAGAPTRQRFAVGLALAMVCGLLDALPAGASPPKFHYLGGAFGSVVRASSPFVTGAAAISDSTAQVVLGCTSETGLDRVNTVVSVNSPPRIVGGAMVTTAQTSATAGAVSTRTTARTTSVNLLNGVVTAEVARAVSTATHAGTGFELSGAGTSFENLVIQGRPPQSVTPGPNTEVELFGFGRAILNEQTSTVLATSAVLSVNAIHVFITVPNDLAIPVGTEIVVSHAKSGLAGPIPAVLGGQAYGTSVDVGETVDSGPSAHRVLPCQGTDGADRINSTTGVVIPDIATSASVTNTVRGTVDATSTRGRTESVTGAVDLLRGVVDATGVVAAANASTGVGGPTFTDDGSSFATLVVRGQPTIVATVPANTTVTLPGIGRLHLRRVIRSPNGIEVRMIQLVVTDASNPQGLPVGLDVRVGVAEVAIH